MIGKKDDHVVGLGFLVGCVVCVFVYFCIFIGHRGKNDRKRASVGCVVGSKSKILEHKIDKIRSVKLVV